MGQPAAKQGDRIVAVDTHLVVPPPPATAVALPFPFSGALTDGLSPTVRVMGVPAATVGSGATNTPPHIPTSGSFSRPPSNRGSVEAGSLTVRINGKPAARHGDPATTCNDPADVPVGTVVAVGTVRIG